MCTKALGTDLDVLLPPLWLAGGGWKIAAAASTTDNDTAVEWTLHQWVLSLGVWSWLYAMLWACLWLWLPRVGVGKTQTDYKL
jgi:hypothetical protein